MDEAEARELLARERARVERALAELVPHAPDDELSHVDQPAADIGTETYDRELQDALAMSLHDELEAIERAEKRLAEGTYGLSVDSGKPIPEGRLKAIPWAERTVDEQEAYERGR